MKTVDICENCEGPFCSVCEEEAGECVQCLRAYCGDCRRRGETCPCAASPDEE